MKNIDNNYQNQTNRYGIKRQDTIVEIQEGE